MNVTETKRRLRTATDLVREARGYPSNWRVEVGTRLLPVHVVGREATFEDVWSSDETGDDLGSYLSVSELSASDEGSEWYGQILEDGYIAHLYFSSTGDSGELEDIVTVWLGDRTHEPKIVDWTSA